MVRAELEIRPLDEADDVSSFDCGDADINGFLKDDALRLQAQNVVQVYLAYEDDRLVGYIALLSDTVRMTNSEREKLGLRRQDHPGVPAIKVGRLGTCKANHGRKIGTILLNYAKDVATDLSARVGCRLLTLDAYPDKVSYYEKNKFVRNKQVAKDAEKAANGFQCPAECPERYEGDGERVSMRLDLAAEETPELITAPTEL